MIEEKLKQIQHWLRYHGDYSISIDVWGMYGCYNVHISCLTKTIQIFRGESFVNRLDDILDWIKEQEKGSC